MKKPVLIISYYWPPAGGPGVQRWLKFAKYLPDHGYEVTVVIPENPDYPVLDQSLKKEIPKNVSIIKARITEPSRMAGKLSRKRTKNLQRGILKKKASFLERALVWTRGNLFIPDARVGWKQHVLRAVELFLSENPECTVITTGPPHSVHLIGLELKHLVPSIKWLADFRDPWTTIGYHKDLKLGDRAQKKHEKLEQKVLNTADLLIVTSPHTGKEFQSKTSKPLQLITNGYDIKPNSNLKQPDGKFVLAHIGTLLSDRDPQLLWESLQELCKEIKGFANDLELQLAGNVSEDILDSIEKYNLSNRLANKGYLSHDQSIELMFKAQVLLLIEIDSEETKAILPGKIFEYFASRRPIIALGPKGADIELLITDTHSGEFYNHQQKMALKKQIIHLYDLYKKGVNDGNSNDLIERYQRSHLTQILAKTIEYVWE
ncbi:MAG: glycosyltransferase family 4 protein [Nonlabens sp.]|uniref:glycosyltransferase family 4 protein n=1 Tax=Nonlabens sp. TaxID=1888209 RepID=UPI00321A9DCD